jgi:hypothetical protein
MFVNSVPSTIINNVFEEADRTVNTFASFSSVNDVAAVYTALVSYFLAGQKMEDDLAHSLISEYQNKIRGKVSETEFSYSFGMISEAYTRFCEKGLAHSYITAENMEKSFADYADIVIEMIGARSNDVNKNHVIAIIYRLFKIATEDYSTEESPAKPTSSVAMAQLAVFCVLYILAGIVKGGYSSFVGKILSETNSGALESFLFVFYFIGLPVVIAFCVAKTHIYIFRDYMIKYRTGIMMFLIICVHFGLVALSLHERYYPQSGGYIFCELWSFGNMIAGFVYFYQSRWDRS